jgi:hypothetical protein
MMSVKMRLSLTQGRFIPHLGGDRFAGTSWRWDPRRRRL